MMQVIIYYYVLVRVHQFLVLMRRNGLSQEVMYAQFWAHFQHF